MFGFASFEETIFYVKAFFTDVKMEFPKVTIGKENRIIMKPSYLTGIEQTLITKIFMHYTPHRTKASLMLDISRQSLTYHLNKWLPLWATFGSYNSVLPMPHDHYVKELPEYCRQNNLNKITHLFDGKDVIIETKRNDDNLRRRTRSKKVHDSTCRTISFTTPLGLSFEQTRTVGARASEKQTMEWWGVVPSS